MASVTNDTRHAAHDARQPAPQRTVGGIITFAIAILLVLGAVLVMLLVRFDVLPGPTAANAPVPGAPTGTRSEPAGR